MSELQKTVFLTGVERVELRDVPVPSPAPGEVLVRIGAATTCGTDVKVFRRGGHPRMLKVPTPFGHEMAGTIAAASDAGEWKAGDRVVVANSSSCGVCRYCRSERENLCIDLQYLNGAYSEYIIVPERFVVRSMYRIPDSLSFELAALAEPLACVLHGYEVIAHRPRSSVLVIGAGPIGLLFVNHLAAEGHIVTAADPNANRLKTARAAGATHTIEVQRNSADIDEFLAATAGEGFDVVIEATGDPGAWRNASESVRPGGEVLLFGGCAQGTEVALDTHRVHYSELTIRGAYHHRPATFARAVQLLGGGRINGELLISARCGLEGVEDALRSMIRKETLKVAVIPSRS